MSIYVYSEKLTANQITEGVEAKVLMIVDAPNPAKADKAFLAGKYDRHVAKTSEALKLAKSDVPVITVGDEQE